MIKAIIFDFDGIIVESADIKTEAFKELFSDYPQKINEIVNYHLVNGGISRYVKFRYIYKQILRKELSREKEIELGKRFSQIVLQKVLSAPFVTGTKEFLDINKNRLQFFIVSGTPEKELYTVISRRGLREYFKEIHGSPKKKTDVIKSIMKDYDFTAGDVIYVGDSLSDYLVAKEVNVPFVGMVEPKKEHIFPKDNVLSTINDVTDLSSFIKTYRNR